MPELERLRDVALFGAGAAVTAWIVRTAMAAPPPAVVGARIAWRPVRSSPAEVTLRPTDDAHVYQGAPGTNYGAEPELYVRIHDTEGGRAYLKFDLSPIPSGSYITSAKLRLYCTSRQRADTDWRAWSVADDTWTEGTLTWYNKPPPVAVIWGPAPIGDPGWKEVDVTSWVRENWEAGDLLVSVMLESLDLIIYFSSKEGAAPPELVVTYEPVAPPAVLGYLDVDVRATAGVVPLTATVTCYVDGEPIGTMSVALPELGVWERVSFPWTQAGSFTAYAEAYAVDATGATSPTVRTPDLPFTAEVAPVVEVAIGWRAV